MKIDHLLGLDDLSSVLWENYQKQDRLFNAVMTAMNSSCSVSKEDPSYEIEMATLKNMLVWNILDPSPGRYGPVANPEEVGRMFLRPLEEIYQHWLNLGEPLWVHLSQGREKRPYECFREKES